MNRAPAPRVCWSDLPEFGLLDRVALMQLLALPTRGAVRDLVQQGALPQPWRLVRGTEALWLASDVRHHLRRVQRHER